MVAVAGLGTADLARGLETIEGASNAHPVTDLDDVAKPGGHPADSSRRRRAAIHGAGPVEDSVGRARVRLSAWGRRVPTLGLRHRSPFRIAVGASVLAGESGLPPSRAGPGPPPSPARVDPIRRSIEAHLGRDRFRESIPRAGDRVLRSGKIARLAVAATVGRAGPSRGAVRDRPEFSAWSQESKKT